MKTQQQQTATAVEAEHPDDLWGDEATCRTCGVPAPCGSVLAAHGRPTVPCTGCQEAHADGDDLWGFPNPAAVHPECAQALQPRT